VVKPVLLIRGDNNVADQAALAKLGIASLIDPYIEIKVASDPHDAEKLLAFLSASESSLMLIATSVNALKFWSQIVGEERLRRALSSRSDLQFAAVGETTASTLRDLGAREIFLPEEATGRALAQALVSEFPRGHALIPGGNLAMKTLPSTLLSAGWGVNTGVVYTTSPVEREPKSTQLVRNKEVSAILFRSPSAVRALTHFVPNPSVPMVCAGATTASALEERGLTVAALSPGPSAEVVASTLYSLIFEER
jgi:uroporphyrinogen-III synthase